MMGVFGAATEDEGGMRGEGAGRTSPSMTGSIGSIGSIGTIGTIGTTLDACGSDVIRPTFSTLGQRGLVDIGGGGAGGAGGTGGGAGGGAMDNTPMSKERMAAIAAAMETDSV